MKQLLIFLASLALFACGGGDTGDAAEEAAEVVEEATETVGKEVADTMQDALQRAEDVGAVLEQNKKDIDAALEDADGAATH
jgi:vacuolar-type H+-ATPase subunit H